MARQQEIGILEANADSNFMSTTVGNEDWFSETYPYRWNFLYSGIKAAYPNLTLVSTAFNENDNYNITLPPGSMWDTHHYEEASFFVEGFNFYDNWQERTQNPDVTIFIGEYSMFQVDTPSGSVNVSFAVLQPIRLETLGRRYSRLSLLLLPSASPDLVKLMKTLTC